MYRLLVVVVAVSVAVAARTPLLELDEEWMFFRKTHNKMYSEQEEVQRRMTWEDNVKLIQKHNLQADRGVHTYWLGMNEYGDLTADEFVRAMNGYKQRNETKYVRSFFMPPAHIKVSELPATVDWRKEGYVTPVKNQGQCGSCWAFSSTGSLEGQHKRQKGKLVSLSEQNLVDCSGPEGNQGCNGGLMDQAFQYVKDNNGIDTEQAYPYKAEDEKCHYKKSGKGATDIGFQDIPHGNETALKIAAATVGPISVAIDASQSSFQFYKTGVYYSKQCSSEQLDHGVLVAGYGTFEREDYWLVKNSWGTTWGLKGYIMMSRNRQNNCGIATAASYPLV